MSRRDGMGEVDGWCHECGAELPRPYTGETELCETCARRGLDSDPAILASARAFWASFPNEDEDAFGDDA